MKRDVRDLKKMVSEGKMFQEKMYQENETWKEQVESNLKALTNAIESKDKLVDSLDNVTKALVSGMADRGSTKAKNKREDEDQRIEERIEERSEGNREVVRKLKIEMDKMKEENIRLKEEKSKAEENVLKRIEEEVRKKMSKIWEIMEVNKEADVSVNQRKDRRILEEKENNRRPTPKESETTDDSLRGAHDEETEVRGLIGRIERKKRSISMEKKREWRSSMEDTMIQKEKEERRGIKRTRNVDDDDDESYIYSLFPIYRKKRVDVHKEELWFIGDSQFSQLVTDSSLGKIAFEEGWEVRMRRGGIVRDLRNLTSDIREGEGRRGKVLICMGGNDLANVAEMPIYRRVEIIEIIADHTIEECRDIVKTGLIPYILLPFSRADVEEEDRRLFQRLIGDKLMGDNYIKIVDIQGEVKRWSFIKEQLEKKGIHIKHDKFWGHLQNLLYRMGINYRLQDKGRLRIEDIIGKVCWRCGGDHDSRRTRCNQRDFQEFCKRCGDISHCEKACILRGKMCVRCGRRGHSEDTCKQGQCG